MRVRWQPCLAVFRDLSQLAQTRPEIKVITFNSEGIYSHAPTDVAAVKAFVAGRDDMNYPIYIDTHRVAVNGACALCSCCAWEEGADSARLSAAIFQPAQNLSIPLGTCPRSRA